MNQEEILELTAGPHEEAHYMTAERFTKGEIVEIAQRLSTAMGSSTRRIDLRGLSLVVPDEPVRPLETVVVEHCAPKDDNGFSFFVFNPSQAGVVLEIQIPNRAVRASVTTPMPLEVVEHRVAASV